MKKIQKEKINMINARYLKRGKKKLGGGEESYEYNRINKKNGEGFLKDYYDKEQQVETPL